MRRPLTAVALLLLAPLAMAQAYKWTDASGTVHYADSPPPKGTQYKRVTTSGTVQPVATPSEMRGSESEAAAPPAAPAKPVADTPENREKLCTTLKSNLELLRSKQPVVTQDGGKQTLLDDTQRKQQQATAEGQYKQFCPNQ